MATHSSILAWEIPIHGVRGRGLAVPNNQDGSNNHKGQPGASQKPGSPFSDPRAYPWVILLERGHYPCLHVDTGPGGQSEQSVHR